MGRCLLWRNLAGATDIIFHPGSYFTLPPEEVLQVAIPRLQDLVSELRNYGVQVVLRPETMGKQAMLGSMKDTLDMSKAIPGVIPCIDFADLLPKSGDGSPNDQTSWESLLLDYQNVLGVESTNYLHIHLSGIEYGPKGEKNHLAARESGLEFCRALPGVEEIQLRWENPVRKPDPRRRCTLPKRTLEFFNKSLFEVYSLKLC